MGFLKSKIFTVLALAAVVWLSWSLVRLWPKKITVENHVKTLEQRIAETEKSNSALAKLLDYFKSPAYLEREAKIKLNVRKPDENVVFIYPGKEGQGGKQTMSGLGRPCAEIDWSVEAKSQEVFGDLLSKTKCNIGSGTVNFGTGTTNFEKWLKYLFSN